MAMKVPRRKFLHLAAGAVALPAVSRVATAQAYPTRPITMIVPTAAGAGADTFGRIIAEPMRTRLGQPIIIENIGGADGTVGTSRAARAKPDGYTIDIGFMATHVLNGAFYSLPYDVLNDFTPVAALITNPFVLVGRKTIPAKDLSELVTWLKANPNKVSAGASAASVRLVTAFFQTEIGARLTIVPYRGAGPIYQDLVAGQIDFAFAGPDALPLVRAGSMRAYAVTSASRLALAPNIPTLAEMGLPAVSWTGWYGLFGPKGMSKDVVGKLNAAAMEALADPVIQSRFADLGEEVFPRERQTPEALGALQKASAEKWWPIIKELGIKP
jgi:tripartite-type tricarboxylate transporter receptor subunit TctC